MKDKKRDSVFILMAKESYKLVKRLFKNKVFCILFIIAISSILFIRLRDLNIQMILDENPYMYIGTKISDGSLPYKDYWDNKPPGLYYSYAFFFMLFGKTLDAIRIGVFLINTGSAILIYLIGRELKIGFVGKAASLIFLIFMFSYRSLGFIGHTDPFMVFFCIASILLFIKFHKTNNRLLLLLSGICIGCSLAYKQSALLFILALVIYFAGGIRLKANRNYKYMKTISSQCLILAAGVLIVWLPLCVFFYINNSLYDFIYSVFIYNAEYVSDIPSFTGNFKFFISYDAVYAFFLITAIVQCIIVLYRYIFKKEYSIKLLFVLSFICMSVTLGIRPFPHYIIALIPFASLLSALTIKELIDHIRYAYPSKRPGINSRHYRNNMKVSRKEYTSNIRLLLIIIIGWLLLSTLNDINDTYPKKSISPNTAYPWILYIQNHTTHDEKVYLFGSNPNMYRLMERDPPTRYFYLQPWTATDKMQKEIINGIESHHDKYIVVMNRSYQIDSHGNALFGQTLLEHIKQNYRLDIYWGNRSETDKFKTRWEVHIRMTEWQDVT